jgi:hypothetical protein
MKWTDVVTNPLGLVAFALALVFGVVGGKLADPRRRWVLPIAIILASCVIVGGLVLAYRDEQSKANRATITSHQEKSTQVKQETHGANSPAVQGVNGDVIINHNKGGAGN